MAAVKIDEASCRRILSKLGASREQIIEAILQLLFYAGAAAVRNALMNIRDIIGEIMTQINNINLNY
ncbi:carboxymuconolactone decarboxylase family protein [Rouxiella sp. S1S-2]|uniref:carboxymuconolactone decarboxylase family protein n=1 Tax=Rouxiella sp. S1S-2 TaxID=2653856 RepID=UPI00351B158F